MAGDRSGPYQQPDINSVCGSNRDNWRLFPGIPLRSTSDDDDDDNWCNVVCMVMNRSVPIESKWSNWSWYGATSRTRSASDIDDSIIQPTSHRALTVRHSMYNVSRNGHVLIQNVWLRFVIKPFVMLTLNSPNNTHRSNSNFPPLWQPTTQTLPSSWSYDDSAAECNTTWCKLNINWQRCLNIRLFTCEEVWHVIAMQSNTMSMKIMIAVMMMITMVGMAMGQETKPIMQSLLTSRPVPKFPSMRMLDDGDDTAAACGRIDNCNRCGATNGCGWCSTSLAVRWSTHTYISHRAIGWMIELMVWRE